jgi:predicted flap endonuclease-1-like 5' DNA nuclease
MFGLNPLSRPVAVIEILLLLSLAAFVGWLVARLILNSRVRALQAEIAGKEAELDSCRRAKATTTRPAVNAIRKETVMPASVTEPQVVPAMGAPVLEVPVELPSGMTAPVTPPVNKVAAPPAASVMSAAPIDGSEDAVLHRIASRAHEINFDRIGRATAAEADDLKEIMGIGPFLERKLHSLGIYTFRQIANFTKEDTKKVNEIIEFFPGRIERDNWVSQAEAIYGKKYSGKPVE